MGEQHTKIRLDIFYKTEEKQYVFLRRLALTFRAKLPLLAELLQIPEERLYEGIGRYNPDYIRALSYLFNFDVTDQELAKANLLAYYHELLQATIKHDRDTQVLLINKISDVEIKSVVLKSKSGKRLTNDEYLIVLNYQLKNAVPSRIITEMLGVDKNTYINHVRLLMEEDDSLRFRYERLADFNVVAMNSYKKYISKGER